MVKIKFDKAGYDPNGLHDELGELDEKYHLAHTETEITLMFPEINKTEIKDEEGNTTDTYYTKDVEVEAELLDEETGETHTGKAIETQPFDFATLEATIESVKATHDPLKRQKRLDNENILRHIKETDSELLRGLEDLYVWAESAGFTPVQAQKDRIAERANLRSQLK